MDTLALLVGLLLCLAVVSGRSFEERRDGDPVSEAEDEGHKRHGAARHRRRRWQTNYGYDYAPPVQSYYPDRREYDRNQPELQKIIRLLEEISVYVKRPQSPPPPPQPIYIPYPVPYVVPQYAPPCTSSTGPQKVNLTNRFNFPFMEDSNQNWGYVTEDNLVEDDGSRPISFDKIAPIRPTKRPAPKVEHGSVQGDMSLSTEAPKFAEEGSSSRAPDMCNAAILSCCADDKPTLQKQCFNNFGCGVSYNNGKACSDESVTAALDSFKLAYSPMV